MSIENPEHIYYHVYDCLSKSEITTCIWADEESGKYCRYKRDKQDPNKWVLRGNKVATEVRRGKIKLIYRKDMEE